MIDPLLSLAFSVHSNKGAYAVLLGSGVSRAAEIPTGWEVVLDLIRKLAKLEGEDCEPEPDRWFREKHGAEPDYSKLLDTLCKTPAERQQLLRSYFEPNEDDLSQGRKLPTAAHKAIAQMVAAGYLKVIVTTNFDRLMERALEQIGVAPSVIGTPDAVKGAMPLAHSKATVVKLHGDYLDVRIKNTPAELAEYDADVNKLLDRVFDEYGLIISGWSGDWDIALRAAMERCPSRRFTTFWTTRSTPSEAAKRLVNLRAAQVIQILDSGEFFEALHERLQALEEFSVPHPLSARIASVTVKRHLTDPPPHIRLNDLIHAETERAYAEMNEKNFPWRTFEPTDEDKACVVARSDAAAEVWHSRFHDEIARRARKYEGMLEVLLSAVMTGIRWGGPQHATLWVRCIERFGNPSGLESLMGPIASLQYFSENRVPAVPDAHSIPVARALSLEIELYPALLMMWGAGLAATVTNDAQTLAAILKKPRLFLGATSYPLLPSLPFQSVSFEEAVEGRRPDWAHARRLVAPRDFSSVFAPALVSRFQKPLSLHLRDLFRERMREWVPIDSVYHECFDRFEHVVVLLRQRLFAGDTDANRESSVWGSPYPWGGDDWSWSGYDHQPQVWSALQYELNPPLRPDGSRGVSALRISLFENAGEDAPISVQAAAPALEPYRTILGWYSTR